jgi:hypothetical protein
MTLCTEKELRAAPKVPAISLGVRSTPTPVYP